MMTAISRSRPLATVSLLLLLTLTLFSAYRVTLARASTSPANIITNPSFENGVDSKGVPVNWDFSTCEGVGNATATLDSKTAVDGNHSARVYSGPITQTYCLPTSGTRQVGFTQFRQFLSNPVNVTDLTDSPDGFSFWFKLQPYNNQSGMGGFGIRIFGAESLAELDYAINPDPSLGTFVNNTSVHSLLFYGYQPGQWYHFSRNLRADWLGFGLSLRFPLSLIQFQGYVTQFGTTVKSETFWLDDVRAYVGTASPNPYLPGVKVGDSWNFGRPQGFCLSPCPPGFSDFLNSTGVANVITAVSGNYVTVKSTIGWANGTTTDTVTTENVETGANITQGSLVVAAGLMPGDHIFNSPAAPTVNFTVARTYAGVARQVNVLDTTNGFPGNQYQQVSSWDQSTGILTEFQVSTPMASIHFSLVKTSLWSGGPDFTISANPTTLIIPSLPNRTGTLLPVSAITLASVNNFTGPVVLVATVFPSGVVSPELGGLLSNTMTLMLGSNGTNQTSLIPSVPPTPTPGTYHVTVTGTSGSLSHSANVTIIVQAPVCGAPQCGIEALSLENYLFTSNTDVALDLRNT